MNVLPQQLATPAGTSERPVTSIVLPDADRIAVDLAIPAPPRRASVEDLVRYDLVTSTLRLLRHEAAIRLGQSTDGSPTDTPGWDHEEVHQARVATRRWRSTLRTFGRLLDPEWSARLSVELFRLAALLGAVRDADVLLAGLRRDLLELPPADAEAGHRLLKRLVTVRATEHRRVLTAMGQPRYAALLRDLIAARPRRRSCPTPPCPPSRRSRRWCACAGGACIARCGTRASTPRTRCCT